VGLIALLFVIRQVQTVGLAAVGMTTDFNATMSALSGRGVFPHFDIPKAGIVIFECGHIADLVDSQLDSHRAKVVLD
jgi:hypothetical protein